MNTTSEHRIYRGKEAYISVVFNRWRKLHITTLTIAFFAAFTACFTFVVFNTKFSPYCPLFANIFVSKVDNVNSVKSHSILSKGEIDETEWGPEAACTFVLYVSLINMLAAVTSILLFCIKGGFSPYSEKQLVSCTCISGLVVSVLSFAAAVLITRGGTTMCEGFRSTWGKNKSENQHQSPYTGNFNVEKRNWNRAKHLTSYFYDKCAHAQYVSWANFPNMQGFYDYLKKSQIAFWVTTHAWFFHSIMALIRWTINADYVIAEERELHERPLQTYSTTIGSSLSQRHPSENETPDSDLEEEHERRIPGTN